jgi:TPR repeat protein
MESKEPDIERLQKAHSLLKANPQTAVKELEALTELGSALAPLYLGWAYKTGNGIAQSQALAEHWLKLSFDRGEIQASYYLGHLFSETARYDDSNIAFERGSVLGYAPSMYCLAMNILDAKNGLKDIGKAKKLLEGASIQGHVFAQRALASLYFSGQYGFLKVGYGLVLLVKSIVGGARIAAADLEDDRLRA